MIATPSDNYSSPPGVRFPPVEASCVKVLACPPREPIELVARIFVEKYLGVVARPARELRQELCEKAGLMGANAVIHIEDQKEHVFASAIRMSQSISIDAGSSTSSLTRTR